MVKGRDSRSDGRGFKSRHHILDGHFSTYICCKNCNDVCLKRPKINEKEAGVGPFFLKKEMIVVNACAAIMTQPFSHHFQVIFSIIVSHRPFSIR